MNVDKAAKVFTQANSPIQKQDLNVQVVAREGETLELHWELAKNPVIRVTVKSDEVLGQANNPKVDAEYLHQQLGRLGNTPYQLHELKAEIEGSPFIPSSLLNRLRQTAVEALIQLQETLGEVQTLNPHSVLDKALAKVQHKAKDSGDVELHLLIRSPEQLEAASELKPASITLDYLELYGLRPAVEQAAVPGVYFVRVRTEAGAWTRPVVVAR